MVTATYFLDYHHERVQAFVKDAIGDAVTEKDRAVRLFYAVRDGLDYEVSGQDMSREGLRASEIVARGEGFCVHKSILYAAAVRAVGIPSRLVVSEVRNHLASPALQALVGGDTFVHWLTAIRLDNRWLHVTPVFNKVLCRLYRMEPLEFDGSSDARLHPFTGGEQMEFLAEHGEFDDVDYDRLIGLMRAKHPGMFTGGTVVPDAGSLADQAG
jgi:hypothetical protein